MVIVVQGLRPWHSHETGVHSVDAILFYFFQFLKNYFYFILFLLYNAVLVF